MTEPTLIREYLLIGEQKAITRWLQENEFLRRSPAVSERRLSPEILERARTVYAAEQLKGLEGRFRNERSRLTLVLLPGCQLDREMIDVLLARGFMQL